MDEEDEEFEIDMDDETYDLDVSLIPDRVQQEIEEWEDREIDNISDQKIIEYLDDNNIKIENINC